MGTKRNHLRKSQRRKKIIEHAALHDAASRYDKDASIRKNKDASIRKNKGLFRRKELSYNHKYIWRMRYSPKQPLDVFELFRKLKVRYQKDCGIAFYRFKRFALQVALNVVFHDQIKNVDVPITFRLERRRIFNSPYQNIGGLVQYFDRRIDEMSQTKSGLIIRRISFVDLEFIKAPSIKGRGYIPTPFPNRFVVNIRNKDD